MPIPRGDGEKGKEAIYMFEKQSRDEHERIQYYLDKQWEDKMRRKQALQMAQDLRQAAKTGDVETIFALLDAGVPVDAVGDDFNQTALHYAAREGRTKAAEALLTAGANPNARNKDLRTPLHWAAANGTASVIRVLAAGGADLEARNGDGDTPLDIANYWNNAETGPALRQLLGYNRRAGAKCEGFQNGVQQHYSVQRVGVFPNTKAWR